MGAIDYGTQKRSVEYRADANSIEWNERNVDIIPRGIYLGGRLTKVDNTNVTLETLTVEIGDNDYQLRVETTTTVNVVVAVGTPYIVLRWVYTGAISNYMDVLAVASGSIQANDIIVGRCIFAGSVLNGFDYNDSTYPRVVPNVQDKFLKVITDNPASMYLWVLSGRINFGNQNYDIPLQKIGPLVAPGSGSRYDLITVNSSGTIVVVQGVAGGSPTIPSYKNKIVLAEILVQSGDSSIGVSRIKDVRMYISSVADEKVKVSSNDTADGYLNGKLIAGNNITLTENNDGGNETFTVANTNLNKLVYKANLNEQTNVILDSSKDWRGKWIDIKGYIKCHNEGSNRLIPGGAAESKINQSIYFFKDAASYAHAVDFPVDQDGLIFNGFFYTVNGISDPAGTASIIYPSMMAGDATHLTGSNYTSDVFVYVDDTNGYLKLHIGSFSGTFNGVLWVRIEELAAVGI
jgi:hypothetical protein